MVLLARSKARVYDERNTRRYGGVMAERVTMQSENVSIQENGELEIKYTLTKAASRFLSRITPDEDVSEHHVSAEQADYIAAGISRLMGPPAGRAKNSNRDAVLHALFTQNGTTRFIAEEVTHTTVNNVSSSLWGYAKRCRKAAPNGVSLEQLIELGRPDYEPPVTPKTAREFGGKAALSIVLDTYGSHTQRSEEDYPEDEPLAWQADALCAQTDPEMFFPEKGSSVKDAKRICGQCEVKNICLRYALENEERFGIWGGLSERERRKLRGRRQGAINLGQAAVNA
jgi:WhiB family redox-sensing transcriptional regulator